MRPPSPFFNLLMAPNWKKINRIEDRKKLQLQRVGDCLGMDNFKHKRLCSVNCYSITFTKEKGSNLDTSGTAYRPKIEHLCLKYKIRHWYLK